MSKGAVAQHELEHHLLGDAVTINRTALTINLTSLVELGHEVSHEIEAHSQFVATSFLRAFGKVLALCACFAILFKMCVAFCRTKRADCRRCKYIGQFMMWIGYDEFEAFDIYVTVHSIGDIKKSGLLGDKEFKVCVAFNWSKFETTATKDCKWEQSKGLRVPQGASECKMSLMTLGKAAKIMNSTVASATIDTMEDMLDATRFWNEKKKYKIMKKGEHIGTLSVTFRKRGEGEDSMPEMPIEGIDPETGLAMEVLKEYADLCETPGYVKPRVGEKLRGESALYVLSRVLTDKLREVDKSGKELGEVFVRTVYCNYADIAGEDRKEAQKKQIEKARKKGLTELERKWYWCWYEDRAAADKKWRDPDGFIPLAAVQQVVRTPGRNDEFIVKVSGQDNLRYRRESGKGTDVWVDGLEMMYQEVRKTVKDKKEGEAKQEQAFGRMHQLHLNWVQTKGMPNNRETWTAWQEHFKANAYDEDIIAKFYHRLNAQQKESSAKDAGRGRRG